MPRRAFIDAVTLNHFAAVDALDLLRDSCRGYGTPLWVEEVRHEVCSQSNPLMHLFADPPPWLGIPVEPAPDDLLGIERMHTALSTGPEDGDRHWGEAQSIYFAGSSDFSGV